MKFHLFPHLPYLTLYAILTLRVSALLDSSLPPAVRRYFLLMVGFAAAGSKTHHQQNRMWLQAVTSTTNRISESLQAAISTTKPNGMSLQATISITNRKGCGCKQQYPPLTE